MCSLEANYVYKSHDRPNFLEFWTPQQPVNNLELIILLISFKHIPTGVMEWNIQKCYCDKFVYATATSIASAYRTGCNVLVLTVNTYRRLNGILTETTKETARLQRLAQHEIKLKYN